MKLDELIQKVKKITERIKKNDQYDKKIKFVACIGAVFLAFVHIFWPNFGIDITSTTLLLIAILIWYLPYIKSIKIPGLLEIELRDLKSATDKITGAVPRPREAVPKKVSKAVKLDAILVEEKDSISVLKKIAESDPNLAFVGFRIELEKKLLELGEKHGIETKRKSLGMIVKRLTEKDILHPSVANGLYELIALGNQAAHGANVTPNAANWITDIGPSILNTLDELIQSSEKDEIKYPSAEDTP